MVRLGEFPLCDKCQQVNGGLTHVRLEQVHIAAHGFEACVDSGLAKLVAEIWSACPTLSCCEDDDGLAYVTVARQHAGALQQFMRSDGRETSWRDGRCYFSVAQLSLVDDTSPWCAPGYCPSEFKVIYRTALVCISNGRSFRTRVKTRTAP